MRIVCVNQMHKSSISMVLAQNNIAFRTIVGLFLNLKNIHENVRI